MLPIGYQAIKPFTILGMPLAYHDFDGRKGVINRNDSAWTGSVSAEQVDPIERLQTALDEFARERRASHVDQSVESGGEPASIQQNETE
jgi:hypothetical protein